MVDLHIVFNAVKINEMRAWSTNWYFEVLREFVVELEAFKQNYFYL